MTLTLLILGTLSMAMSMSDPLQSVAKRNFNRQAKFKQLRNGQAVHAELSCSSSGNFNIYNTVVLETHSIYDHAWVREHCLISYWQPALNHQFILKYLKVKS
jgi:hypothetical protein